MAVPATVGALVKDATHSVQFKRACVAVAMTACALHYPASLLVAPRAEFAFVEVALSAHLMFLPRGSEFDALLHDFVHHVGGVMVGRLVFAHT
jgi:hypothetical protein